MDVKELQSLNLKLLIHKKKKEVIYAEADNYFVDVLFSFMTIPIGALIKLIGCKSFGCISNLYASVENLDDKFLASKIFREVLLHPRSAGEIYLRDLKVSILETDVIEYFGCEICSFLGYYYQDGRCRCHNSWKYKLTLPSSNATLEGSFTKSTTSFMLTDDLHVRPISIMAGLTLLKSCGACDKSMLEERTVNVGKDKVTIFSVRLPWFLECIPKKCTSLSTYVLTVTFFSPTDSGAAEVVTRVKDAAY